MEILIIIAVVAAAAIVIMLVKRGKKGIFAPGDTTAGFVENLSVKGIPKQFPFQYKTPDGVNILSVAAITEEQKPDVFLAVEYGITNQLNATTHKFPEWTKKRGLSDYTVAFIEPHAANGDGSPALMVRGKYQTAGTVIGIAGDRYPLQMIVLPHQAASDWKHLEYLMYSSWFESEHDAEFSNDLTLAMSYAHSGDVHQHHNLPEGVRVLSMLTTSAKGFVAKAKTEARCYFKPEGVEPETILIGK